MTAKHKHSTNDNAKEILSTMMRDGIPRHAELDIIDEKPLMRMSGPRRVCFDLVDGGIRMNLFADHSIFTDGETFFETTIPRGQDEAFLDSIIVPFEHGYGSQKREWAVGALNDEKTILSNSYHANLMTFRPPLLVMAAHKEWRSFWSGGTSNEHVPLEALVEGISSELPYGSVTLARRFQFEGGQYGLVRTGLGCLLVRTEVVDVDGSADCRIWRSTGGSDSIASYLDTDHVGRVDDCDRFGFIDAGGDVLFLKKDDMRRFAKWVLTVLFGNGGGRWRSNELAVHTRE